MKLRAYEQADAGIICQWLKSEKELYQWSADRFNKFPLTAQDINENYAPQIRTGRFFPLTALDEENHVIGHFIIRYPREDDNASVRLGFVILNPAYRGKGCGKEMLRLGVRYAKEHLHAARVDLGVFANNDSAPPSIVMRRSDSGNSADGNANCQSASGNVLIWNCIRKGRENDR